MKIYNFNENFIIKKLQKKEKNILHNDANSRIYTVTGKLIGEVCLVELPLINKIFMCDRYTLRGDVIIATTLEDNYVSIINTKTGSITKAQRIDVNADKMIVTLQDGKRHFIDKGGKIEEAEIGTGGFKQNPVHDRMSFVDENGNMMLDSDETFVGLNGRVRAGKSINSDGIYEAISSTTREKVYYSFLGDQIEYEDLRMYRDLYKFYKGEKKLSDISNIYLLDATVYNFLVDEVNKRLQNKFWEAEKIKGRYDKTAQRVLTKLQETLRELEERRNLALENSVTDTLNKSTYSD